MDSQKPLDFNAFVALLRRRALLIVGIAVAAAALAFGASSLLPDRYDASANVLFRPPDPAPQIDPDAPPPDLSVEPERVAATNLALASLEIVAVRVQERLDTDESPEELRDKVSIEPKGQADVAEITARADSPQEAARLANAFATEIVALRQEEAQKRVQKVIDAIESQLSEAPPPAELASQLRARVEQLKVEKRLEAGDAELVEEAVPPTDPSSPKPVQNAAIGGLLGLLLGIVVALLMRRLDRGVRDEDEVQEIVGAPVVARIPSIKKGGWQNEMANEAFQFLRANLQLASGLSGARTIVISSALPEEGKTTTVVRLAEALGQSGSSAIVVDCDLRRPMLHRSLGVGGDRGVSNVFSEAARPGDLLLDTPLAGVRLLPAGPPSIRPGTLVTKGDHDVVRLLERLREMADYVLIDTSPVTIGADASIIAARSDATLLVVDLNGADRNVLRAAVAQLGNAGVQVSGVILNHADELLRSSAYQGYYGAGPDHAAPLGGAEEAEGPADGPPVR